MTSSIAARLNRFGAAYGLVLPKMYDSVTVSQLPAGAFAYAGYMDGNFATWTELCARFLHSGAHLLSITVNGADWALAHVIDDEPGDEDNAQSAQFSLDRLRLNSTPIVYTQASNIAALESVMRYSGIARSRYLIWSAHYTGSPHFCSLNICGYGTSTPADATQYASSQYNPIGGNKDITVVSKAFFGKLPAPTITPPAKPAPQFNGPLKVKDGYYWWRVNAYAENLSEFAQGRNTTAQDLIAHTLGAGSPIAGANKLHFAAYAKANPAGNGRMPNGLVFYTVNG